MEREKRESHYKRACVKETRLYNKKKKSSSQYVNYFQKSFDLLHQCETKSILIVNCKFANKYNAIEK